MIEKMKRALLGAGRGDREKAGRQETLEAINALVCGLAREGRSKQALEWLARNMAINKTSLEELHSLANSPMEAACSIGKGGEEMIRGLLSLGQPARGVLVVSQEGVIEPLEICFRRGRWGSAGLLLSEIRARAKRGECEEPGAEALRWAMECCAKLSRRGASPSQKEIRRLLAGFESLDGADSGAGGPGFRQRPAALMWRAAPCVAALKALIEAGAPVDERFEGEPREAWTRGSTALHKAAREADAACVEELLGAGADPLMENERGLRASGELAARMEWKELPPPRQEAARGLLERLIKAEHEAARAKAGPRRILARGGGRAGG